MRPPHRRRNDGMQPSKQVADLVSTPMRQQVAPAEDCASAMSSLLR